MAFSTPDHIQPHPPTADTIGEWLGNMTPAQRKVLRAVLRSGFSGYMALEVVNQQAVRELVARNILMQAGGVFIALPYIVDLKTAILAVNTLSDRADEAPESDKLPVIGLAPMAIIERAVKYPNGWKTGVPRWSAVGEIFQLGCTSSTTLCVLCGADPHDMKLRGGRVLKKKEAPRG